MSRKQHVNQDFLEIFKTHRTRSLSNLMSFDHVNYTPSRGLRVCPRVYVLYCIVVMSRGLDEHTLSISIPVMCSIATLGYPSG